MSQTSIARYYDYTLPFYKIFWHKNDSNALHYGLWEKDTDNLQDALINTNRYLAKKAHITKDDTVLDVGCGIGGSSIWLVKNIGCNVVGITISDKQVVRAKELAKKHGVDSKVQFFNENFTNTKFNNESFDIVWAIESVCHAIEKSDFLNEAYRILKKGGRLVLADGFLKRDPIDKNERKLLDDFCVGLELPNMVKFLDFEKKLNASGFRDVVTEDKSDESRPSSKKLYNMCRIAYPITRITGFLGITPKLLTLNSLAGIRQYEGGNSGLFCYGIFYAKK